MYSKNLANGRNSITIKYEIDGKTYSFEYFLANKMTEFTAFTSTGLKASVAGSSISLNGSKLTVNAISNIDVATRRIEFTVPVSLDFAKVHNFNFTVKNTGSSLVEFEVYVKGASSTVRADKIAVFPYETYEYSMNYLYEKVEQAGGNVSSIILRFVNYTTDSNGDPCALPNRTLELYDFNYSLK